MGWREIEESRSRNDDFKYSEKHKHHKLVKKAKEMLEDMCDIMDELCHTMKEDEHDERRAWRIEEDRH